MAQPVPALPYLTADLPGIGGTLKKTAEDFEVEEIPAYEPEGHGDHLYLWIEKRGTSADFLVRHVANILGLDPRDIGTAGLKDTQAVTRQYLSVPSSAEPGVRALDTDRIRVLKATRHTNKLRTGHLDGNRFTIRVRDVTSDALTRLPALLAALNELGVPNFFGLQRFGREGETLAIGLALLRHERHPALDRSHPGRRGFLTRLALSAAQSAAFNQCLATRLADGLMHTPILGEVMQVSVTGGPFVVDDVGRETPRLRAREIVPAGPMFGPKMRQARGEALERELAALHPWSLVPDQFDGFGKVMFGTRRPNLIWPAGLESKIERDTVELSFSLRAGAYATVVLREIMKNDPALAQVEAAD